MRIFKCFNRGVKNLGDRACAPRFYRTKAVRGFYKTLLFW